MTVQEEFEDTKRVIRICKSKKDIQRNGQGQKKKDKSKNNDLQNTTHRLTLVTNPVISHG